MKIKLFTSSFLALAISLMQANAQAPATDQNQTQLIEKVVAKPGELLIGYEKYRLPNGLTVIIHEDHSDPIVNVDVTYHVGSARETPGKSGFAHFFEHMMFQGSDHVADEEHFKMVEGAGGEMNGTTNRDRTNYFEILPKNYLETALWLEADRMGFLLDAVTQKKFEVQRSTVKNEKGQRVDNVPYGRTDEIKDQILYPAKHPYNWPTIGYVEDLDRVNVEDLKNFFMRWYGPNNASVTIAGDVNPQEALKLVEKYFGSIPRGPEVRKQRVDMVRLPQDVYANFADNVYLPLLYMVYPGVPNYHPDEPALDILAAILGDGNNSIFYKNFVKSEKALQASVFNPCFELAGEFTIQVVSYPFGEEDMERLVKQTLDEFDANGFDDDALTRAKAGMEQNLIQSAQSILGKSFQLSQWNYLLPNKPWNINDEFARYKKVTKEDVMRVFRQYIKGKNAAIVNVFPKGPNAKKDETPAATSSGAVSSELEYKGLSYKKPTDNFDRSKKPDVIGSVVPKVPDYFQNKLPNGLTLMGTTYDEAPIVTVYMTLRGGSNVVGDPSKAGLANLTAAMMEEATQKYTSEQFSNELGKLGSSISFNVSKDYTTIYVSCHKNNLDRTMQLFEEKLLHPKFNEADFKRVQKQIAESINSLKVQPTDLASKAFGKLMFGKTIAAEPVMGSIKTIKGMSVKDVQMYYDKYYSPSVANVIVVGDISQTEVVQKLNFLKDWAAKEVTIPAIVSDAPAIEKTQIYLVDKYKAAQSEIRVGYLAIPYDYNGKYFKATVMNFPLGGQFNSRLNLNLREDKGFTYGIYSSFQGSKNAGPFAIGAGVRASSTDSSLKEIFYELNKYRNEGIKDDELAFAKKSLSQSDALQYENPFQKAQFLSLIANYNLPKNYQEEQNKILQSLTKEEINALAKELLPTDKMIIVIVGDKEKIQGPLQKLGYKIVDMKMD